MPDDPDKRKNRGQGYNFGKGSKAREMKARLNLIREQNELKRWTDEKLLELSDIVSDAANDEIAWAVAGFAFDCDPAECKRAFKRVAMRLGWQAV